MSKELTERQKRVKAKRLEIFDGLINEYTERLDLANATVKHCEKVLEGIRTLKSLRIGESYSG